VRVKWTRTALANLDEEAAYIAQSNPQAAADIAERIEKAVQLLADFPAMGRPGRVSGTRELVVTDTPYIVPYRIRGETVHILRVFHTSRKWPSRL
jgi:addiction module RelE/StbE family toxin